MSILVRLATGAFSLVLTLPTMAIAQQKRPDPSVAPSAVAGPPRELGGISLPSGFQHVAKPRGHHGEVWGMITGPGKLEIEYSIWPVARRGEPRTSASFVSDADRLGEEHRLWFKEQYIGDDLVQLALSKDNRLMVSYPARGINLSGAVNGEEQLTDALLIMLSIPNQTRGLSWKEAKAVIETRDVASVFQSHSLAVVIRMTDGARYRTKEPKMDAVVDVLKKCGKWGKVGFATE